MNPKAILLETIPPEGLSVEFSMPTGQLAREFSERGVEGIEPAGDLRAEALLTRSGPDLFVIGRFRSTVKAACVRCLDEFETAVAEEIHLDLSTEPLDFEGSPGEFELTAAELEVDSLKGDSVDLEELFVEQLILALPGNPVCKKDCAGLCHLCGKKLEGAQCDCGQKPVDPRFSALAGLKIKNKG